jgi:hypothetical protein
MSQAFNHNYELVLDTCVKSLSLRPVGSSEIFLHAFPISLNLYSIFSLKLNWKSSGPITCCAQCDGTAILSAQRVAGWLLWVIFPRCVAFLSATGHIHLLLVTFFFLPSYLIASLTSQTSFTWSSGSQAYWTFNWVEAVATGGVKFNLDFCTWLTCVGITSKYQIYG